MTEMDRRRFLALAGLATGGLALGACDTAPGSGGGGSSGASGQLQWWDQFQPISEFEKTVFADFAQQKGGLPVQYTVQNPENQGRALQLAFQSKQLPDVFTLVGVAVPPAGLVEQGWFSPLALDEEHRGLAPEGTFVENLNVFDGKTYSFPLFSFRSHDSLQWFNKDLYQAADLDPENPPTTYDDIRAAARAIKKAGDGASGWIAPIKFIERLQLQVLQLAAAGGAPISGGNPPVGGADLRTGEYAFDSDPFVNAIEWWTAMEQDGVLFPASSSLDARTARARWATGVAGFFLDGSYCIGVLNSGFQQFVDKVGVGSTPVPEAGASVHINGVPANPSLSFWIAGTSKNVDKASELVSRFLEDDVQTGVAEAMDQPPLVSSVLESADVHPTYSKAVEVFNSQMFLGPNVVARNPDVVGVLTAMRPVEPTLGQIVQGAVTGEIEDWRGALTKLSDDTSAERDQAIADAKGKGATVGLEDWQFTDWAPGADYETKPA